MEQIEWQKKYETGIEEIDTQHKQIADYLNQLREARISGNLKAVEDVLEGMIDYTLSHFAFEEALMEQVEYQFSSAHKNVHSMFIKRVEQFHTRFQKGENITQELHALLKRWLINHIQRDDAAYVKAVHAHMDCLRTDSSASQKSEQEPTSEGSWFSRTIKRFFRQPQ